MLAAKLKKNLHPSQHEVGADTTPDIVEPVELMIVIQLLMKAKIEGIVYEFSVTSPRYSSDGSRFVKD